MNKEEIEERISYAKSNFTDGIEIFLEIIEKQQKELEQKESILDKVTDKLKEGLKEAKEQIKYWEEQYRIAKEKEDEFYMKSYHRKINRWQSRFETLKELLEFIEGEKK